MTKPFFLVGGYLEDEDTNDRMIDYLLTWFKFYEFIGKSATILEELFGSPDLVDCINKQYVNYGSVFVSPKSAVLDDFLMAHKEIAISIIRGVSDQSSPVYNISTMPIIEKIDANPC